MDRFELSMPECYLDSADFRFFLKWASSSLYKIQYDLDTFFDLYDPLRCPKELLWMLADTIGFKFDDRLPTAYNRLVLLYFMSMIRYKGSRNGILLAANLNLTQQDVLDYQIESGNDIDLDRLNFTNIRVNSAYVNVNNHSGYIDVVYYSTEKPIDACIEYVRPIGMYCFQHSGVVQNARTKLAIDVRLTDNADMTLRDVTATQVGRYSRDDYASIQKGSKDTATETRQPTYSRNSVAEQTPTQNAGYRSLYSLQLANNQGLDKLLKLNPPIFSQGYFPQDFADVSDVEVDVVMAQGYNNQPPEWNLLYDRVVEESVSRDITTIDIGQTANRTHPKPAVNPIMTQIGDALSMNNQNSDYANRTPKSIDSVKDSFNADN